MANLIKEALDAVERATSILADRIREIVNEIEGEVDEDHTEELGNIADHLEAMNPNTAVVAVPSEDVAIPPVSDTPIVHDVPLSDLAATTAADDGIPSSPDDGFVTTDTGAVEHISYSLPSGSTDAVAAPETTDAPTIPDGTISPSWADLTPSATKSIDGDTASDSTVVADTADTTEPVATPTSSAFGIVDRSPDISDSPANPFASVSETTPEPAGGDGSVNAPGEASPGEAQTIATPTTGNLSDGPDSSAASDGVSTDGKSF